MKSQPTGCVTEKPIKSSIILGGRYINLSAISRTQDIDLSYLSRIINGKKEPTIRVARKVASAIGMGLEEFLDAIDERVRLIQQRNENILEQYKKRVHAENVLDHAKVVRGKIVKPRLPGLRLPEHTRK